MRRLVADDESKRLVAILGQKIEREIGRDIIDPAGGLLVVAVDLERAIGIAALADKAGRIIESRPLTRLLPVMELADVAGRVARLAEQRRPGHVLERERCVIVRHAVEMAIAPCQIDRATGSTERVDDECIAKPHAFARQSIQIRRLKPREASFFALFALHDAQGVPPLIVGVDEKEIRPVRSQRGPGGA